MILVDDRSGSKELLKPLKAAGLDVELSRLHAGDLAFEGKGVAGKSITIGIEHKRLDSSSNDIIQSLRSGRLSGEQLPKMLGEDGVFDYAWVVIQGQWRVNSHGEITVYKGPRLGWKVVPGRMTESELKKHLLTFDVCAGLRSEFTADVKETVKFVQLLYRWFNDRALDEHTSHLQVHVPQQLNVVSKERRVLSMWPGVGLKGSAAILKEFGSIYRATNAPAAKMAEVTTLDNNGNERRLGMATASKIVAFLKGEG
jgi:ERCC4-type nuclease